MQASRCPRFSLISFLLVISAITCPAQNTNNRVAQPEYETRADHDPNGIGKFYMGREIAQVMGHQGAEWLERTERQEEERPDLAIPALKLKGGDAVADSRRDLHAVPRAGL